MKQLWYEQGNMDGGEQGKIHRIAAETRCFKEGIKLRSWNRIDLPEEWWLRGYRR